MLTTLYIKLKNLKVLLLVNKNFALEISKNKFSCLRPSAWPIKSSHSVAIKTKVAFKDHFERECINDQEFCSDNDETHDYRNYCSNRYGRSYNINTG